VASHKRRFQTVSSLRFDPPSPLIPEEDPAAVEADLRQRTGRQPPKAVRKIDARHQAGLLLRRRGRPPQPGWRSIGARSSPRHKGRFCLVSTCRSRGVPLYHRCPPHYAGARQIPIVLYGRRIRAPSLGSETRHKTADEKPGGLEGSGAPRTRSLEWAVKRFAGGGGV